VTDAQYADGMAVRRSVLGDAPIDRATERTSELAAPWQEFITRRARARGAAQGAERGRDREVLLHTAVYAGVPASNCAFAIADEALAERE
jgi:hypothetical protein